MSEELWTEVHDIVLEARKHLAWYLRGVSHAAYYKKEICSISTVEQAMKLIDDIKRDLK